MPRPGDLVLEPPTDRRGRATASLGGGRYCHARIFTDDRLTVEAAADGARIEPHSYEGDLALSAPLTDEEREAIPAAAYDLVGTPYDNLALIPLALAGLGLRMPWLDRELVDRKRMTCAELVLRVWREVGFDPLPGVAAQSVTPGDLADVALRDHWPVYTFIPDA